MDWKRGTLTIATADGDVVMRADIAGPFAIHGRYPIERYKDWTLTHIPTGLLIGGHRQPTHLRKFAEAIEMLCNWAAVTKDKPVPKSIGAELRSAIQEFDIERD